MLVVLPWLSFHYGSYNGAMIVALTEIVAASVRTAGSHIDDLSAGQGNADCHCGACHRRPRDDGLAPTWFGRDHSQETPTFQALPIKQ